MIILISGSSVTLNIATLNGFTVSGSNSATVLINGVTTTVDGTTVFGPYAAATTAVITAVNGDCSYGLTFPESGEVGKTYINDVTGCGYRWDADTAGYVALGWNADRTALVDPVTGETITHSRILANERPNFEVSGSTTETEAARIQIRGGEMKLNSVLLITTLWTLAGADTKNLHMRAGNDATTTYATATRIGAYSGLTSQKAPALTVQLWNNDSLSQQMALPIGATQPFGVAASTDVILPTIDTSLDWSIYLGAKIDALTDPLTKCVLLAVLVELK